MNSFLPIFLVLLLPHLDTSLSVEEAKDTPHYDVVSKYVRSLAAVHKIQIAAEKEFKTIRMIHVK